MPGILKRERPYAKSGPRRSVPAIAALIANVEASVDQLHREPISHRQFREFVRDQARSQDEAWAPIRTSALYRGLL